MTLFSNFTTDVRFTRFTWGKQHLSHGVRIHHADNQFRSVAYKKKKELRRNGTELRKKMQIEIKQ